MLGHLEIRNKVCFDGKKNNPIEIIGHACAFMRYWTGLYAEVDREMLINGVNTMLRVARGGRWVQLEQREHQEEDDQNE
jgi:hypothetical protein